MKARDKKILDNTVENYYTDLSIKCTKIFNEIVKPYCDKNNLQFVSANGSYAFFVDKKANFIHEVEHKEPPQYIVDFLDYELSYNLYCFELLPDYTPLTYKNK